MTVEERKKLVKVLKAMEREQRVNYRKDCHDYFAGTQWGLLAAIEIIRKWPVEEPQP